LAISFGAGDFASSAMTSIGAASASAASVPFS
jgi:hypothetical protein